MLTKVMNIKVKCYRLFQSVKR